MKVLLINPWAINNDQYYASGFVAGMSSYANLDFISNYYYPGEQPSGTLYPFFFRRSELMKSGIKRKILRGIEYIIAWMKIIRLVKKNQYDVVHIHWLLMYKIDLHFLRVLKQYAKKLVLTAHNVIPHTNGEDSIEILKKIYSNFDYILVHGITIKDEFRQYFPELSEKVFVQYHGYFRQDTNYMISDSLHFAKIQEFSKKYKRIFVMFGRQFYNKGTDRLIRIWLNRYEHEDAGLLILGRSDSNYPELQKELEKFKDNTNILVINEYIDDNSLNYAISISQAILLPYRHASMSGVVYTAAAFSKTVLCTKSGALAEYLENGVDSIVCGITDNALTIALDSLFTLTPMELNKMGERLSINIAQKYAWSVITRQVAENIYQDLGTTMNEE